MGRFRKYRHHGSFTGCLAGCLLAIAGMAALPGQGGPAGPAGQAGPVVSVPAAAGPQADAQAVAVTDDTGRRVVLGAPARRVIALSPSLTELAFAAGGGPRLVGVAEHSNYPEAARSLPRIGDALSFQLERILALKPDLILAWEQGNNPRQLERLAALGVPIYYSQVGRLEDVATTLERLGVLLGTQPQAAADDFRRGVARLGPDSSGLRAPPVRVLYQVWAQPLMTVSGRHVISDLIERCGGVNVFAAESALVPQIGVEAAIAAAPDAIIASGGAGAGEAGRAGPLEHWRRYPAIPAVARDFLFLVDWDAISRPGPRLLDAGLEICAHLDSVRRGR
jgi:iron complex transport system substrate-binding protein